MSLKRRIAKVEREHQGGERMFVSVLDSELSEAEQEAFAQAEAERLGVGPNDLHVFVRR
jgi:hypothetical protein